MLLSAVALIAVTRCTEPQEFRPALCPAALPPISAIAVTTQGVRRWNAASAPEDCRRFRPTPADMRRYFTDAKRVDPQQVHYALPESACIATGSVKFADGRVGHWTVDRFRIASLDMASGGPITLYCDRCRFAPFAW